MTALPDPVLEVRGVSKTFEATRALANVSFSIPAGSLTALLGENGSGKSTLIKIITGYYDPDDGSEIIFDGQPLSWPADIRKLQSRGLGFVHQDLGLIDELSVADNMAVSRRFATSRFGGIDRRAHLRRAAAALEALALDIDPARRAGDLSMAERTLVAIARAFDETGVGPRRLIILDEPTAALPAEEVERLFELLDEQRRRGAAVIVVTHRLDEAHRYADRVAILRDGELVADRPMAGLGVDDLVALMLGQQHGAQTPNAVGPRRARSAGEPLVQLRGVGVNRLRDVDLDIHTGEIVGVTGIVGCGRSELARALSGAQQITRGILSIDGRPQSFRCTADALAQGIAYVPQNRRELGCLSGMTLQENLTIGDLATVSAGPVLVRRKERAEAQRLADLLDIRPREPQRPIELFSGGNQQKAVIGRCLRLSPRLLVLDEPTQGIDIGARTEIGELLRDLCAGGMSVLLASSDQDELADYADRVVVLDRGYVGAVLIGPDITRAQIASALADAPGRKAA